MPAYAPVGPSRFRGGELAIQFFHLLRRQAPSLEDVVQFALDALQLCAERFCFLQALCIGVELGLLQVSANLRNLLFERCDALLDFIEITLSPTKLAREIPRRTRSGRGFCSAGAFETLALVNLP